MKITTALVTPKIAAEMLQHNERNRKINRAVVERYKNAIRNNAWTQTGEAIKFSKSGRLIDGQHRLIAIAELEGEVTSISLLIIRGLEEEAQRNMDRGRARRVSDELTMQGVKNTHVVASVIRVTLLVQRGALFMNRNDQSLIGNAGEQDILEYAERNPEVIDFVSDHHSRLRHITDKTSVLCAGLWIISQTGNPRSDDFRHQLITGQDMQEGDAVLTLRERLIYIRSRRDAYNEREHLWMLFRAWNAFVDNQKMKSIILPRDGGVNRKTWITPKS